MSEQKLKAKGAQFFIAVVITFRLISVCSLFILPTVCQAQHLPRTYAFERTGQAEGLFGSDLYNVYQDKKGFLWICSVNGVLRYDGVYAVRFPSNHDENGESYNDFIVQVLDDAAGRVWALSEQGELRLLDPAANIFNRFPVPAVDEKRIPVFSQIEEAWPGYLWLVHPEEGLFLLDVKRKKLKHMSGQPAIAKISLIASSSASSRFLYACDETAVHYLHYDDKREQLDLKKTFALAMKGKIITMKTDKKGHVWLAGRIPDVIEINPEKGSIQRYPCIKEKAGEEETFMNRVNTLCIDVTGKVWAGTNTGGVVIIDPDTRKAVSMTHEPSVMASISHNTITKIIQDRSGVIWLTTWGNGLNKYVPAKAAFGKIMVAPTIKGYLKSTQVSCFYESDATTTWIATSGALHELNTGNGTLKAYTIPREIHQGQLCMIHSILSSPATENVLYLATNLGLIQFNRRSGVFTKWRAKHESEKDLENRIVYYLSRDKNGIVHAVTYSPYKLYTYAPESGRFQVDPVIQKITTDENVIAIIDKQANLWISIDGKKIYRYSLAEKKLYEIKFTFSGDEQPVSFDLGHVYTDSLQRIWIGSPQGLFCFEKKSGDLYKVKRYTEKNGLPDRIVVGLLPDDKGFMWISTVNGLVRMNMESGQCHRYFASDGLVENEFSFGAYLKSKYHPWLYLGSVNGCTIFNPEKIIHDPVKPVPVITKVESLTGNTPVTKNLSDTFTVKRGLIFQAEEKVIHFSFAGLHYADPDKNMYSYRLRGFSDQWSIPGLEKTVTFTNLAPGTYQFEVKASNKDLVWNDAPATLPFKILPPWYKTWWAYILYIAFLTALLYYIYTSKLKSQRQISERKRMEELDKLKTRLYANITHEFRTPLTVILGIADQLQKEAGSGDQAKIGLIRRNGQSLLDLINQMLELARLESGGQLTRYVFGDIVSFIEYSLESFQTLASSKQVALHFVARQRPVNMDYDPEKLLRIIANLVSNAIKFTPTGGDVTVYLDTCARSEKEGKTENAQFIIEVHDTGIGIPENQIPRVFDRFFQVDESNTRKYEGSGIGLALTKELVQILDGDIQVKSELGKGSIFRVSLPITQNSESVVNASGLPAGKPVQDTRTIFSDDEVNAGNDQEVPLLLIIEDNPDLREYVRSFLSGDFRLDFAENGAIGVEKALDQIPDIIVSDVMMPEMDGFEVLDILKNDRKTSHIPIIMLTARAAVEDRLSGLKKGADAYMAKPFLAEELQIQIRNLLLSRKKLQEKYSGVSADSGFDEGQEEEDVFLLEIKSFLEQDLSNADLSMEEMSGALHMSRMQLHRKIKALTGLSASIYVRNFRLQKAKHLLETTNEQIAAIAYQVGFNDPKYFSRVYQEYFGFSPSDQRKIKS